MTNPPPVQRRPDGTVMPGSALNPSGRPKVVRRIQEIAQQHTDTAMARIVELVSSRDERIALAASQEIFDRAFGKPVQATQTDVRKVDFSALYLAGLKAANGHDQDPAELAKQIEGNTEHTEAAASDEQVMKGGAAEPPVEW